MTKSVTHRQHARNTLVIRPQQDGGAVEDTRDAQPASRSHQERSDRYLAADPRSHAERPGRRVTADASSRRFLAADARRRGPNAASPVDAPLAPGTEAGRPDRDNPPPTRPNGTAACPWRPYAVRVVTPSSELLVDYKVPQGPDEMFAAEGAVRPAYARFAERLAAWNAETLEDRQRRADLDLLNSGITFTVYHDDEGTERSFPFSLIPRIVAAAEWQTVEQGLAQRVRALNAFLADIYHEQRCVTDEVIPADILFDAPGFGLRAAHGRLHATARRLYPHLRQRLDPRSAGTVPRAGGQRPHPPRACCTSWRTGA